MELDRAWARVMELVAAPGASVAEGPGGTTWSWRPPGEDAVDETGDMPWLEHTICTPLTERDTRRLERELRRPLPPALRALYRDCTRGVNLLGHDLSIYGFRTGLLPDPY